MPPESNLLTGENVRLTAITDQDLKVMAKWYQDTQFLQLFDARPAVPRTSESLQGDIEELQKSSNDFVFAIKRLNDDTMIGYLEIDGILWSHGVGGFGIGIGESFNRSKGFGTEASKLALRFAFHELNLHRITATVFSYNRTSQLVLEKLGFQHEGTFREFLRRDGQRYDMLLYGLLSYEWEAHQS